MPEVIGWKRITELTKKLKEHNITTEKLGICPECDGIHTLDEDGFGRCQCDNDE